jgi:surface protein
MCRSAHPKLRMKRIFKTFIVALCLTAVACTDYQVDIDELNDRVDGLEKTQIANISQQIKAINASLPQLENTDSELKTMISSMKKTIQEYNDVVIENETKLAELKAEIEAGIADLKSKIEASQSADKKEMLDALTAAKAEIEAQLAALQAEANSKFEKMNNSLETLQAKDDSIEARIADLKTFVNTELVSQKSWAEKTFATLEKQNEILGDIEGIKGDITNLQTSLTQLEERITNEYTEAINSAVATLEDKIAATANEITTAYKDAITKAKGEIKSAYEAKIASSIDELEKSLKGWVNEKLKGYYTIAETDNAINNLKDYTNGELKTQLAYITALQNVIGNTAGFKENNTTLVGLINANKAAIESNDADILKLQNDLAQAIKDLTAGYTEAITQGIAENGVIDKRIDDLIYNNNILLRDNYINPIKNDITALQKTVNDLRTDIDECAKDIKAVSEKLDNFINGRIQSLTYIPTSASGEYFAGMINCEVYGDFVMKFQVNPVSMAKGLTLENVSAKVSYLDPDPSAKKTYEAVNVKKVVVDETTGILTVTVAAADVFNREDNSSIPWGYHRAAISVSVKDIAHTKDNETYYDVASEFVYLNAEHFFMNFTTSAYATGKDKDKFFAHKYNLSKGEASNCTAYEYEKATEHLLGHNFVYVNNETQWLDIQLAKGTGINVNDKVKSIFFGPLFEKDKNGECNLKKVNPHVKLVTGENAFSNSPYLDTVAISLLDVTKVESFKSMFENCYSLKLAFINGGDVEAVETMESMFKNCRALTSVDFKDWKTTALTSTKQMFMNCTALTKVDLTKWDLADITDFSEMFSGCTSLTKVVTANCSAFSSNAINFYKMFDQTAITKVNVTNLANLKISSFQNMFNGCTALTNVTISGSSTNSPTLEKGGTNVTYADLGHMFDGCYALTSVDLSNLNFTDVADFQYMFNNCRELQTVTIKGWKMNSSQGKQNITSMFAGCNKITTVYMKGCDANTTALIKQALANAGINENVINTTN